MAPSARSRYAPLQRTLRPVHALQHRGGSGTVTPGLQHSGDRRREIVDLGRIREIVAKRLEHDP